MNIENTRMIKIDNTNQFWLHYLSLEKALMDISEYITICEDNKNVYSFKIMQLYFAVCSEIDSIFKHIRSNITEYVEEDKAFFNRKNKDPFITMDKHKKMLTKYFSKVGTTKVEINVSGSNLQFQPLKIFLKSLNDESANNHEDWWEDYNAVKHQRLKSFEKANLNNLLSSLSALHILNLLYAVTSTLDLQILDNYDSVLIEAEAIYQYPVFRILNSIPSSYAGGGFLFYRCYLNHQFRG